MWPERDYAFATGPRKQKKKKKKKKMRRKSFGLVAGSIRGRFTHRYREDEQQQRLKKRTNTNTSVLGGREEAAARHSQEERVNGHLKPV